jgi:hypothetical protein
VALVELAVRRFEVARGSRSTTASEVPFRLRVSASFPARGPVGVMVGGALRIPPTSGKQSDLEALGGPALDTELLAGLEVRL